MALIGLDHDEFIRRVKVAAEQAGYKQNIAFWKRDSYTYQQEVRFVFTSGDENIDHIELDISDISDITAIILSKSALLAMVEKADPYETKSD